MVNLKIVFDPGVFGIFAREEGRISCARRVRKNRPLACRPTEQSRPMGVSFNNFPYRRVEWLEIKVLNLLTREEQTRRVDIAGNREGWVSVESFSWVGPGPKQIRCLTFDAEGNVLAQTRPFFVFPYEADEKGYPVIPASLRRPIASAIRSLGKVIANLT